jgi:HK97 gp10 family phage protein
MAKRSRAGVGIGRQRTTATFEIEGLKELDAALGELGKATARNVMMRALTKSAEPIRDAAKAMAPRDKGTLAQSITISAKSVSRAGKKAFAEAMKSGSSKGDAQAAAKAANKGAKGKDTFSQVFVGPSGGVRHGYFNEFGTENMAAQPFMRPAFDVGAPQSLASLKTDLAAEIEKARARAAKKALKRASLGA